MQMLKKGKRSNNLRYLIFFFGTALLLQSCDDKSCTWKLKDERTINEFYVQIDSCRLYKEFYFHQYFDNKGLFMSGFGDRLLKQGNWEYFNGKEKVATGQFVDGVPVGDWDFKNFKKVSWRVLNDSINGFEVSIPISWVIEKDIEKQFLSASSSSESQEVANINILVTNYDHKLSEYLKSNTDSLKIKKEISEVDLKELKIDSIDEAFQRKFKIDNHDYEAFVFQTFYARKSINKVWILTINSDYNTFRRYLPLFDIMLGSFKFN